MKIFLTGFMGVGKSTIGKKLGKALKLDFIDMDQLIESREGVSIAELFVQKGEQYFRQLEKETLEQQTEQDNFVLGTGGGTPCHFNNMETINNAGCSIWLQMPPEVILERVNRKPYKRPLIADLSEEERLVYIKDTLEKRKSFYAKSHLRFNSVDVTSERIEQLAGEIKSFYSRNTLS